MYKRQVADATAVSGSCTEDTDNKIQESEPPAFAQNNCDGDSDVVDPSVASRQSCVKDMYSDNEVMVIQKCCGNIISKGPISQALVTAALNADVAGQELLQKYTIAQVINRVKYERRLLRNRLIQTCRQ